MQRTKGRSNSKNRVLGILNERPGENENPQAARDQVPNGKRRRKRRVPQWDLKYHARHFAFIFVILAIIGGLYYWVSSSDKYLREHGVKVVGTLSDTGGKNVTITFSFLGEQYKVVAGQTNDSLQDGETYTLLIDKDDPTDFLCDFTEPVFDMSEFNIVKFQSIKSFGAPTRSNLNMHLAERLMKGSRLLNQVLTRMILKEKWCFM